MARNEVQSEATTVRTERLANQALPSSTLVSQQSSAQVERTEIVSVINTNGVASIAGTSSQILVNGGTSAATGAVTLTLPATVSITTAYQVSGTQVVSSRKTGWAAWSGSATRTSKATYSGTASAGYVQAELQAVMDKLKEITEAFKASLDDDISHGLKGT